MPELYDQGPEFDIDRLLVAWQEAVFALYLAEEKIEPEVVENMRCWPRSGFRVDQSVLLPADDQAGIERLIQYMTRCPFSLSRLVKVSDTGQIVYLTEKQACRAFPEPKGDGAQVGVMRNFQRHRHVPGHLLIIPDTCRYGEDGTSYESEAHFACR